MKIVINIDAPEWDNDTALTFLDFMLEEVWLTNASAEKNAKIVNFLADDEDLMEAYEDKEA